jgi:hypothetical protein
VVVAVATIMLVELAGHAVYPPPPGIDPNDPASMARLVGMLPTGALLFVVAAWTLGAFDGGLVAALVARDRYPRVAALVPALLVMAGVAAMIVAMPAHPLWMSAAGLLLPVPAALAGAALAGSARAR